MAKVTIYRPKGYQEGAWRAEVVLDAAEHQHIDRLPVPFKIPSLTARSIIADKGYAVAVPLPINGAELQGVFINGHWEGHVYSNGVEETNNPTSVKAVADSLKVAVDVAVSIAEKWNEAVDRIVSD
jgi:hypothetical protein